MQKQILNYELIIGPTKLSLPADSTPICVDVQFGQPQVWVEVPLCWGAYEDHFFTVVITGQLFEDSIGKHLATFQLEGGGFIGHVYHRAEL